MDKEEITVDPTPEHIKLKVSPYRPPTNDKPSDSQPTVASTINGLSLLCTNPSQNRVEIGFIGCDHGPILVSIIDPHGAPHGTPFVGDRTKKYYLNMARVSSTAMGDFYEDGRLYPVDPEDFRWMPDLHLFHTGVKPKSGAGHHLSAILFIQDATFYTAAKSIFDATIEEVHGWRLPREEKIGRVLGANITCDPRNTTDTAVRITVVEVESGTTVFDEALAKGQGTWKVKIETIPDPETGDHMPMLYDLVDIPDSLRFSIRYKSFEPPTHELGPFIGNLEKKLFYPLSSPEGASLDPDASPRFDTFDDALEGGFTFYWSDQYACQPLPDGDGPIDFP